MKLFLYAVVPYREFVSDSPVGAFDLQLIFGLLLTKQYPSVRLKDAEE